MQRFLKRTLAAASIAAALASSPANAGDFNGDGKIDLLWRGSATGTLAVWALNGTAAPGGYGVGSPLAIDWAIQGVADFNGDRRADILMRDSSTGAAAVWVLNGATIQYGYGVGSPTPLDWSIEGVGDFDGDGKADIVWRQGSTGTVAVWLLGGGATPSGGGFSVDNGWALQGVGDFNGDGKSDLLWRQLSTGTMAVWIMNGAGYQYGYGISGVVAGVDWFVAGVADFNGDGRADILFRNKAAGTLAVWVLNSSTLQAGYGVGTAMSSDWVVQDVGDMDGDRTADILWRSKSTGAVTAWLLRGGGAPAQTATWQVETSWAIRPGLRGALKLAWNDNSSNEDGFIVERALPGSSTWSEVGRTGPNVTTFSDEGTSPFTRYRYRVRAFKAGSSDSASSNEAEGSPS